MDEKRYEYYGLMAETWDLLRGDTSRWSDRPFYRQIIDRYGEPALDVGCGTGRLLLDYRAHGYDVDGVDNSPEMLLLCREKANKLGLQPSLHQQRMETLVLPRTYRTIFVPSSSFQLLTEQRAAQQAMARFHAYLASGGALVMPFIVLWREGEPVETEWDMVSEVIRPSDGAVVRRWSRSHYEPEAQLENTEDRYEIERDGEMVATEYHQQFPGTRWYTQPQARQLYEDAGFTQVQLLEDFTFDAASPDAALFTVLGVKA